MFFINTKTINYCVKTTHEQTIKKGSLSFTMATKSRHYTLAEKNVFLQILEKCKHIIECKRSCADTLRNKEATWKEICDEFNNSSLIVQDRTVQQLKKLWSNLKQIQRDALTREKQARFATGGGPEELSTDIDPDIAMIAQNLMTTAPIIFTSNMNDKQMEDAEDNILEHISMNSTEQFMKVIEIKIIEITYPDSTKYL